MMKLVGAYQNYFKAYLRKVFTILIVDSVLVSCVYA